MNGMDKFFYPRSMVVIGASVTKLNLGQIILLNNKQQGYEGSLYGVGREEGNVTGVPGIRPRRPLLRHFHAPFLDELVGDGNGHVDFHIHILGHDAEVESVIPRR